MNNIVEGRLREIFIDILGVDSIDNIEMNNQEWDSLAHLNLMSEIEDEFDIEISIEDMSKLTSFQSVLNFLK